MDTERFKLFFTRRNILILLVVVFLVIPNTWRLLESSGFGRPTPSPQIAAQYGIVVPPDTICFHCAPVNPPFSSLKLFSKEPIRLQPEMGFRTREISVESLSLVKFRMPLRYFYLKFSGKDIKSCIYFERFVDKEGKSRVYGNIIETKKGYYLFLFPSRQPAGHHPAATAQAQKQEQIQEQIQEPPADTPRTEKTTVPPLELEAAGDEASSGLFQRIP